MQQHKQALLVGETRDYVNRQTRRIRHLLHKWECKDTYSETTQ